MKEPAKKHWDGKVILGEFALIEAALGDNREAKRALYSIGQKLGVAICFVADLKRENERLILEGAGDKYSGVVKAVEGAQPKPVWAQDGCHSTMAHALGPGGKPMCGATMCDNLPIMGMLQFTGFCTECSRLAEGSNVPAWAIEVERMARFGG